MLSVAESLFGDFSLLASDFFVLLFVESALLFFSALVPGLFDEGLVALSAAELGLFAVEGFEAGALAEGLAGEAAAVDNGVGFGVMMAPAVPLALGAADVAGVAVAAALAEVAGDALALVDALELVVVVAPLVLVLVTPMLKLGVTP